MTATLNGHSPRQHDESADPAVVARVHRVVGEALTAAHAAQEETGRPRLSAEDERALARKLVADELRRMASEAYGSGDTPLDAHAEEVVSIAVLDRLHGLARLQPLLDDPSIRDIHISGHERVWLTMRDGTKVQGPDVADSDDDLIDLIATAARRVGRSERRWDNAQPELNLQLPDGSRLFAVAWVCDRPSVSIRRHRYMKLDLSDLVELGAIDDGRGAIIGLEDDQKLRRALAVTPSVSFYRYEVTFKLLAG